MEACSEQIYRDLGFDRIWRISTGADESGCRQSVSSGSWKRSCLFQTLLTFQNKCHVSYSDRGVPFFNEFSSVHTATEAAMSSVDYIGGIPDSLNEQCALTWKMPHELLPSPWSLSYFGTSQILELSFILTSLVIELESTRWTRPV